jgi:hypothetical protein
MGDEVESRFSYTLAFTSDHNTLLMSAPLADDGVDRVYTVDVSGTGVSRSPTLVLLVSGKDLGAGTGERLKARSSTAMTVSQEGVVYIGAPYATVAEAEQGCFLLHVEV